MIAPADRAPSAGSPALAARGLTVGLGGRTVLHDVSLTIDQGDRVAIVGPNGSGKSTLVRSLAGLLKPEEGTTEINGRPVRTVKKRQLARELGLLAQSAQTPPMTTVREHVGMGRHAHRRAFAPLTPADGSIIARAMETCQVAALADRRLDELSGGERQRVRLATLLAQDPGVLLLDEPLTGLDIDHQLSLLGLLRTLNEDQGRAVVCVLHDLNLALRYFTRLVVIHDGRIVRDGPPREVICSGLLREVFRVDGRLGAERGGEPIVVCDRSVCATEPFAESCPVHPPVHPTVHVTVGRSGTAASPSPGDR